MALDLRDVSFAGPALPEPFVRLQLEALLSKRGLLAKPASPEGRALADGWDALRRKLRELGEHGGALRVKNHVLDPLAARLGYARLVPAEEVATREGSEDGGHLFESADSKARLRAWALPAGTDLDAPARRGRAYRFSPERVAARVLLASGERAGLLTDGLELRLLVCDPARPASHLAIRLDRSGGWRGARDLPDSLRLLRALASPEGLLALPEIVEEARLAQTGVTGKLRRQAQAAVIGFVQEVLDRPENRAALEDARSRSGGADALARELWKEGLLLVYRLLFVLELETSADPARAFSFAATSLWRSTFSPQTALAPLVRRVLDGGAVTGGFLEGGLRALFRVFEDGLASSELRVHALGGMLFGKGALPLLGDLVWGERAVARLLDRLLWTDEGGEGRARVHYGSLGVEDLGRVYEALLELESGIAAEPMARLRRAKLEVVVPAAQADPYRASTAAATPGDDAGEDDSPDTEDEDAPARGKSKVVFVEDIPEGRFFLRVGLGRKSSGSYYTPHAFVRFLVQETLGTLVAERSPAADPRPAEILRLRVLDPAMGSGHFLVEACRFLGDALYEACRLCDELAAKAEDAAEKAAAKAKPEEAARERERAAALRRRIEELPDPDDALVAYLPSRAPEGGESGHSQSFALALCRRLVAVHCLYGVDKNPLAVELAKLALWLESYSEGYPLTFLDHRLVCGDSLTGPFFEHLLTYPAGASRVEGLFVADARRRMGERLAAALALVRDLDASVGADLADLERKRAVKARLDAELADFRLLAAAWSGAVQLGDPRCDPAYEILLRAVAQRDDAQEIAGANELLARMVALGREGVAYDLTFPEVFHPDGHAARSGGFDAVLGNPPWDAVQPLAKEFFAAFDLRILDAPTRLERAEVEKKLTQDPAVTQLYADYVGAIERLKRLIERLFPAVGKQAGGRPSGAVTDSWQAFAERGARAIALGGGLGFVLPSAFHANQSATGIRSLYLSELALRCCFSFENRKKLFEIDSRFKFAVVIARRTGAATTAFDCAFYLHDLEWLFGHSERLRYTREFVERTGGEYLSLLELRSDRDVGVAERCFGADGSFGAVLDREQIRFGEEMHMSKSAFRFTPVASVVAGGDDPRGPARAAALAGEGWLVLHEGKTFHQYDDRWGDRPRYLVHVDALADKPAWREAARFYRLAFRDIASSTNERTGIFALLPPGSCFGNTAPCERDPYTRASSGALGLMAAVNAFAFDWGLRQKSAAHVNLFILNGCPVPALSESLRRFLAHCALRLTCNHSGYEALWREQLGDLWRESRPPFTWPVLEGGARAAVRAAIDAAVAKAYGLGREPYAHVLASFSHRSYPDAPERCLAAFDALERDGDEAFFRASDPYFDIPLVETLPAPVIDLPAPAPPEEGPAADGASARPHAGPGGARAASRASATGAATARPGRRPPRTSRSGQMDLLPPDDGPLFHRPRSRAATTGSVTPGPHDRPHADPDESSPDPGGPAPCNRDGAGPGGRRGRNAR